jgi:hypothetical protein
MACPQCGSEVPSDDAFCGKCGYAMREGAPERVDQSRIRVHEEPDPAESSTSSTSQQRIRKGTMVGMPALTPSQSRKPPAAPEAPPPTEISAARERAQKRTPQKTMLGIPRPDFELPPDAQASAGPPPPPGAPPSAVEGASGPADSEGSTRPARVRARVRYDSANESFPMLQRRRNALRGLAVLVALSVAWFAYRFFSMNG